MGGGVGFGFHQRIIYHIGKKERGEVLCATGYTASVNIHYCIDWNGSYSNDIHFNCPERKRTIPPLPDNYIGENTFFFSTLFGNKNIYMSCAPLWVEKLGFHIYSCNIPMSLPCGREMGLIFFIKRWNKEDTLEDRVKKWSAWWAVTSGRLKWRRTYSEPSHRVPWAPPTFHLFLQKPTSSVLIALPTIFLKKCTTRIEL